ncbi:MAG: glycosyltransferase [Chlorogloea purpurea SAG 13.99]|nr:glycosyltransferase [Chlorogloea purpurea SAG 13.99]
MRIAYLTGEYPRATDTFIQREVAALRDRGVEVHTFSIRRTGDEHIVGPEQQAERERTFYILPPNPLLLLLVHLQLLFSSPQRYFSALKLAWSTRQHGLKGTLYQFFYFAEAGLLVHQVQKRGIEHLHNHIATSSCTVAMLAAQLGGFTYSFTLHGPHVFFEPYRWRLDEKIRRALFVSCISHFCRSQAMLFSTPENWPRLHIVHCGVEPKVFNMVTHEQNSKRLLYVGRLAPEKGVPILLESMVTLKDQHPEAVLTLVGDGSYRSQLETLSIELGIGDNVKFVGYKSGSEVREYLQQTDVFVLPSFAEGVPVVLMEAMAAGVPVVATGIAGVGELVEDRISGYLVRPGDTVSLTDGIVSLLNDAPLRSRMGAAGREKVETQFNIESEVDRLYSILKDCLREKI